MNILITGGTGIIGSFLYNALKNSFEVFRLSRSEKSDIIFDLNNGNPNDLENILVANNINTIIHCAGSIEVKSTDDFVLNSFAINKFFSLKNGRKMRHIVVGSIAELGDVESVDDIVCAGKPVSEYGISKLLQTTLCYFYYKNFGFDIQVLRLLNVLAPNMPERTFFGKIIKEAKKGAKGRMAVNSLDIKRDFIDIRDFSELIKVILEKGNRGFIFNIGSGKNISYGELFGMVKMELENRNLACPTLLVQDGQERKNDIKHHIHKIDDAYKWQPKYKIEDTIKWCLDENDLT